MNDGRLVRDIFRPASQPSPNWTWESRPGVRGFRLQLAEAAGAARRVRTGWGMTVRPPAARAEEAAAEAVARKAVGAEGEEARTSRVALVASQEAAEAEAAKTPRGERERTE
jgi:hypothetical protein